MYGGSCNASTSKEETKFFFSVSDDGLDGSLDRFSRLFVEPLMLKDSINRERESVDSEFQQGVNEDIIRVIQLTTSLANEGHPANSFLVGNSSTLKDNITDDELYKKVHEFRERFYVANRAYLCIQSERSLDDIQELVVKHFADFPENPDTDPHLSTNLEFSYEKAYKPEYHEKVYYVKPKKDNSDLVIAWCLPSYMKAYRTKPIDYLTSVLDYEGPGSLHSYLSKK